MWYSLGSLVGCRRRVHSSPVYTALSTLAETPLASLHDCQTAIPCPRTTHAPSLCSISRSEGVLSVGVEWDSVMGVTVEWDRWRASMSSRRARGGQVSGRDRRVPTRVLDTTKRIRERGGICIERSEYDGVLRRVNAFTYLKGVYRGDPAQRGVGSTEGSYRGVHIAISRTGSGETVLVEKREASSLMATTGHV